MAAVKSAALLLLACGCAKGLGLSQISGDVRAGQNATLRARVPPTLTYLGLDAYSQAADFTEEFQKVNNEGVGTAHASVRLTNSAPAVVLAHASGGGLARFLEEMEELQGNGITEGKVVLLAVNGDEPLDAALQNRIYKLTNIKACFSTNLQKPMSDGKFFPLPVGLVSHQEFSSLVKGMAARFGTPPVDEGIYYRPARGPSKALVGIRRGLSHVMSLGSSSRSSSSRTQSKAVLRMEAMETQLMKAKQHALPWSERSTKLLVGPMDLMSNFLRRQYLSVLRKPEYKTLVHIVDAPMELQQYLKLVGQHRAVLSLPGKEYDCPRTWEALALGSVPLVFKDPVYDQRLFAQSGAQYIPALDELTVRSLMGVMAKLQDPGRHGDRLLVSTWADQWRSRFRE